MQKVDFSNLPVMIDEEAVVSGWIFPEDRFVEYEKKDETWCRFFGIGHHGLIPAVFLLDGEVLMIHPSLEKDLGRIKRNPNLRYFTRKSFP